MSRWIDADKLKEALKQNLPQYMWGEMFVTVNTQPSIDIVRCGECKHSANGAFWAETSTCVYEKISSLYCKQFELVRDPDDYCSYGERSGR